MKYIMENPYGNFVHEIWEEFPQLAEWHNLDNQILPIWKLEQFIEAGYHNFDADRKPLYHLSKIIEKYAQDHKEPLLATFEKIAKFSYVKERYQEMVKDMPKVWIIADFDDEVIPADVVLPNSEFISCSNTNLANVWSVFTRGPYGPFGLIAEEYEDGKFRGFFTLNSNVCRHALNVMGNTLGSKFDIQ